MKSVRSEFMSMLKAVLNTINHFRRMSQPLTFEKRPFKTDVSNHVSCCRAPNGANVCLPAFLFCLLRSLAFTWLSFLTRWIC